MPQSCLPPPQRTLKLLTAIIKLSQPTPKLLRLISKLLLVIVKVSHCTQKLLHSVTKLLLTVKELLTAIVRDKIYFVAYQSCYLIVLKLLIIVMKLLHPTPKLVLSWSCLSLL